MAASASRTCRRCTCRARRASPASTIGDRPSKDRGHGSDISWALHGAHRQAARAVPDRHAHQQFLRARRHPLHVEDHARDAARAFRKEGFGDALVPPDGLPAHDQRAAVLGILRKLVAYAHDKSGHHFPMWAEFNKRITGSKNIGIWHETYLVEPGKYECIYGNMPLFGLAAATSHVPAEGRLAAAKERMSA